MSWVAPEPLAVVATAGHPKLALLVESDMIWSKDALIIRRFVKVFEIVLKFQRANHKFLIRAVSTAKTQH
jgi:hypothetical protein